MGRHAYQRAPAYEPPVVVPPIPALPSVLTPIAVRPRASSPYQRLLWEPLPDAPIAPPVAHWLARHGHIVMATRHEADRAVLLICAKRPAGEPVPVRHRRYPVLDNQVRCSSGVTFQQGGAMRCLSPLPVPAADTPDLKKLRRVGRG